MMTTYRERREGGVWEKGGRKKEREEQKTNLIYLYQIPDPKTWNALRLNIKRDR